MNCKRKAARIPALTPELAGQLAAASAPATLAPERQMAIGQRLLARVRGDPRHFVTVRRDDGVWRSLAPDISMKVLHSDDSMQAFLLRLEPGACLPGHPHVDDEMCFVLEGEATLGDVTVGPGDYHLARAGSVHGDVTTRTGCLLLLRSGSGNYRTGTTARISRPAD
jgi:mannose-6-phosphate isomerase-like protein (cupin superfamily)